MSEAAWRDAWLAARIFALNPAAHGGICLRARPGPARDAWLAGLRAMLPSGTPIRRVPLHITDERLLGGLDLAATLRAGRPVAQSGLLGETDGGVLLLAMAERIQRTTAAHVMAALDAGEVVLERDGITRRLPCRAGFVLLDEGDAEEERPPAGLLDRCAFLLDLSGISQSEAVPPALAEAAPVIGEVPDALDVLAGAALALGVDSPRTLLLAFRIARAAAALAGRAAPAKADVLTAVRLVLAPRATMLPAAAGDPEAEEPDPGPEEDTPEPADGEDAESQDEGPDHGTQAEVTVPEMVLDAAWAAIPAGLLAMLQDTTRPARAGVAAPGRAGIPRQAQRRGRPVGTRRGELVAGARLNVVETLRTAAPWQRIRHAAHPDATARVLVRPEDFRITRFQQHTESTVIFVVDASGSAALNRLGEAKGAVELLLADCYVRRDRVALLAFRGKAATLLLPPTNSLVRAKRSLAGLAGGGGTPLASAIAEAAALADQVRRRGQTPFVLLLTDGRANIARDGTPGRAQAGMDAAEAARTFRAGGYAALLIDTSPAPAAQGQALAGTMGAQYLPLPYADSAALSQAVRQSASVRP